MALEQKDAVAFGITCILVIILVVIIIQVFLLKAEIAKNASELVRHADDARTSVLQSIDAGGASHLHTYSILVDTPMTALLSPKLNYHRLTVPYMVPKQFSLPHVCSGRFETITTDMYTYGILSLYTNHGATLLAQDVANGRVQYVILRGRIYAIDNLDDAAIKKLEEITDTSGFKELTGRRLFALYPLSASPTPGCKVVVASPFVTMPDATSGELAEDLKLVQRQEPLHMLGYH